MNKAISMIVAALALAACGQSARLGSLGRNDTVVTNTVHQSLAPVYAYTDDATNELSRAMSLAFLPRSYGEGADTATVGYGNGPAGIMFSPSSLYVPDPYFDLIYMCNNDSRGTLSALIQYPTGKNARMEMEEYVEAATNAVAEQKQDVLPYPTNAIPYAVIDGAPSGGGAAWNVNTQDCDFVEFVTNGMAHVRWWNGYYTDISDMGAWPDGAAMMVRFVKQEPITSWSVSNRIRMVGYGTWPTNDFQSVWWRSGTNIFVNILVEE